MNGGRLRAIGAPLLVTAAATAFAALPREAQAQTPQVPGSPPALPSVGGPQQGLHGALSAAVRYDPQAARGNDAVAAARGLNQDELTYALTGGAAFSRTAAEFSGSVGGAVNIERHQKNDSLNTDSYSAFASGSRMLGPCNATAGVQGSRRQTLLEQLDLSYLRNTTEDASANASVQCEGPRGIIAGAQAAYSTINESAVLGVDSDTEVFGGHIGYGNSTLGQIDLAVTYNKASYDRDPASAVPTSNVTVLNYSVGYTRPIGRSLLGTARIGIVNTKASQVSGSDSSDLSAEAKLDYRLGSRISATLNYLRTTQATNLVGAYYTYDQSFSGAVGYNFSERLTATLSLQYRNSNYRGQVLLPGGGLSDLMDVAKSTSISPIATVNYRVGRRINTSLSYSESLNKNRGVVTLAGSPLSQLTRDHSRVVTANVAVELPRKAQLGITTSYERRTASTQAFDFSAFRAGVTLSASF